MPVNASMWMDKVCMLRWVKEVLKPYLAVNPPPPDIIMVILLDAYQCHMMASVTNAIADLGIKIISIPGGCTGLCQPLDVRINKPFKAHVRNLWEEWMIEEINRTGMVFTPMRGWKVRRSCIMHGAKRGMTGFWRRATLSLLSPTKTMTLTMTTTTQHG